MGHGMGMGLGLGRLRFDEGTPMPKITKALLTRILRYFAPYWKRLLVVALAIGASSILGLIPQFVIKNIVDKALPQKDLHLLGLLVLASFGATVIGGLIGVLENYLNTWISSYIVFDMKNQLYEHLEYMSMNFFASVKPGEIITRITSDIGGIQNVFRGTLVNIVQNLLIVLTTAGALFYMQWKLALIGLLVLPTFVFPTRKVGKVRWKIAAETQAKTGELNQIIQESLSISGATLMKIFTKERDEYDNFSKTNNEVTKLALKESLVGRWFQVVVRVFNTMGPLLIYFFGGYLFVRGEISVGGIIAFVAMLNRLYGPVTQLSNIHIDITRSLALFERVFEYLDRAHEIEDARTPGRSGPSVARSSSTGSASPMVRNTRFSAT